MASSGLRISDTRMKNLRHPQINIGVDGRNSHDFLHEVTCICEHLEPAQVALS